MTDATWEAKHGSCPYLSTKDRCVIQTTISSWHNGPSHLRIAWGSPAEKIFFLVSDSPGAARQPGVKPGDASQGTP